jgi:O-antigen/teichoic acid export membrane protein
MIAVASGLVILGGASYVHLAVAGHALKNDPGGHTAMSEVWAIVFSIGLGLFMPIEQEITRFVAARRSGPPKTPVDGAQQLLRKGATLAAGMVVVAAILLAAFAHPIANAVFDGKVSLVWALGSALAALACQYPTRGVLAGSGAFGWYGAQLGIDGGLRVILAVSFGLAGVRSPFMYALILTIAPVLSVLATLRPVLRLARPGAATSWAAFNRGLWLLLVTSLLAQLMVNIGVVNAEILDPGDKQLGSAVLAAIVLARVPLFVFASLQASLLPGLSAAAARGDRPAYRGLLTRALGLVAVLGVGGGVPAVLLGAWLVPLLFSVSHVLSWVDFLWFALGTTAYMAALVLGQAVQAIGRHGYQTISWLVGTTALVLITVGPGDVKTRVEIAYLAGSVITAGALALVTALVKPKAAAPEPVEVAVVAELRPE